MANDNPVPDDGPAPDPFEAELVAYLDGELDPAAARKVEARLAKDPAARARAAELKKSFDLLDYLPRPEPSPTFTTRTLDKLPAIRPAVVGAGPGSATPAPVPATAAARPGGPVSTSMPVPLDDASGSYALRAAPRTRLLRGLAVAAAVCLFAGLGYFAAAAVRSYFHAVRDADEARVEVEPRVIENLPLYAAADDVAFVTELAKPELFGDDPSVAYDPTLKAPPADGIEKPGGKHVEALAKAFRALPHARQLEIVKLDHDLHAKEPRERDRLVRALEAYAAWLERLPESERKGVLSAATPGLRLGVVRDVRERQWLDALPPALRAKPELIQQWKEEEAVRRDRLAFVRQHAEAFAANKSPWPFDTEAGKAAVLDYARDVLKVDDPRRCRLSPEELAEYRRTLAVAQRDAAWAWYGLLVYELASQHPYLPEPADPKQMYADVGDLPDPLARFLKKSVPFKLKAVAGKWPEFPLQLHAETQGPAKFGFVPPLGPARLNDFKEPVRTFAAKELFPKLAGDERSALQRLEGRWPEYPQRFLQYAHRHDLPVPGVTLPGPPRKWDATYGARPARPGN
jgi:hypothetical protein